MKRFPGKLFFAGLVCIVMGCSKETVTAPLQLTTTVPTNITATGATSGGTIVSDGGSAVTARGVCWSSSPNPSTQLTTITNDGGGSGTFVSTLTGLSSGTWYVRAYAINGNGKVYGNEIQFAAVSNGPEATVSTQEATDIHATTVMSGGNITSDGGTPVTARGICWSTNPNPTVALSTKTIDGSGVGAFTSSLTGLTAWTIYYAKAYATNGAGTWYGNEVIIIPIPTVVYGGVNDIDGNSYKTVVIGTKTWMAENLRTSKYQDGTSLLSGINASAWATTVNGAFIDIDNSASNAADYGPLYNSFAVADARNLCPAGWHIPSGGEWSELATVLGGAGVAGTWLKETGTTYWASPNVGANNSSGFSGRGAGSLHLGNFVDFGTDGYWWSSGGSFYYLTNDLPSMRNKGTASAGEGLSVRCVKD